MSHSQSPAPLASTPPKFKARVVALGNGVTPSSSASSTNIREAIRAEFAALTASGVLAVQGDVQNAYMQAVPEPSAAPEQPEAVYDARLKRWRSTTTSSKG